MKLERDHIKAKIKGDAGVYNVWAINWLHLKVLVCRACGNEWVSMEKVTLTIDETKQTEEVLREILLNAIESVT